MLKLPDCPPVAIGWQSPPLELLLDELELLDEEELLLELELLLDELLLEELELLDEEDELVPPSGTI